MNSTNTRILLIGMPIAALLVWSGLLLFTRYLPPKGALTFMLFFMLLALALLCTLAPLIYGLQRIMPYAPPVWAKAIRQSGLLSLWVIFNLVLRVLHSWNLFTAIASFGIIVVVEILLTGQK